MRGVLWPGDAGGVELAAFALAAGGVIGFPTDTVFGIGASAVDRKAIARLFQIKRRPETQPLILMAASSGEMERFVKWPPNAAKLIRSHWPGPLTLIVAARRPGVALRSGGTVGVRIPAHPLALELLRRCGPLATTSANRHGEPPALDGCTALRRLPGLAGALQDTGGEPMAVLPSSILDLTREEPVLLREGGLSARELGVSMPDRSPGIRRD
ncbi:MAG: L-threonylcarbamoyladenylate synthase [Candidatus Dormibacteria bacterium]